MSREPAIETHDLSYRYQDGVEALRGVGLRVLRGESVALVGPNGAGKSTLILHFNGSISHAEGRRVRILGLPVVKKNLREVRRRVGVVFQDPDDQLFSPTVFEDVAFGPLNMGHRGEELSRRVRRALEAVGIPPEFDDRLSHHLSFGEKKRIAIATVLSMDISILVMDEPSSNLDPAGRRSLIELLRELPLTKLIATHDLELALDVCERVVLLDRGVLIADGPAHDILADRELMEAHRLEVPLSLALSRAAKHDRSIPAGTPSV